MDEANRNSIIDIAKHLVTLGLAAMGFVLTIMFTSLGSEPFVKVTEFKNSLQGALILFFISVIFGFLVQAATLSIMLGHPARFFFTKPTFLLVTAWVAFVFGAVELVVFAWATTFGGVPLGF